MTNDIGILDINFKHNNPLTGNPYSSTYKELFKKIITFPVYQMTKEIIKNIQEYQVLLIEAKTGSGKTVLLPKMALHSLNYKGKIGITLPKQIIVKASSEFSAATLDVEIGTHVGYKYKGTDISSADTKLLYMTDGTLVSMLLKDSYIKNFDIIIIDEAHEMNNRTLFLLYLLRETLRLRPEYKLIIMSATIKDKLFENYYKEFKYKKNDVGGGRTFPIETIFLEKSLQYNEIINEGYNKLIKILEIEDPIKPGVHDVIFFITSANEAFNLCKRLNQDIQKEKNNKCKNDLGFSG